MNPIKALAAAAVLLPSLAAQTVQPPFTGVYVFTDLGAVPGVPAFYGGVVFKQGNPNKLLLGGAANTSAGAIYEVDVVRDSQGFVTGFSGTATILATAPNIDGGLAYGPNGVLFCTAYPTHKLHQIKPGSSSPDKTIDLGPLGVTSSVGSCNFVPPNFPGAGELKILSYNGNTISGFQITPDGSGTFDLTPANGPVPVTGNPEGLLYVPPGSALIPDYQYVLINEYGGGRVVLYQVDANGNPILSTLQPLLTGLGGAEGACTDPVTGDLVFSTFGSGSRIVRITGFGVCGSHQTYGNGIAGGNGVPTIQGGGCAGRGQITTIDVQNAPASTSGLLAVGFNAAQIPIFSGELLVDIVNSYFHLTDASGQFSLAVQLPIDPLWSGLNIYSQSWYLDPTSAFGVSATPGLHTQVR